MSGVRTVPGLLPYRGHHGRPLNEIPFARREDEESNTRDRLVECLDRELEKLHGIIEELENLELNSDLLTAHDDGDVSVCHVNVYSIISDQDIDGIKESLLDFPLEQDSSGSESDRYSHLSDTFADAEWYTYSNCTDFNYHQACQINNDSDSSGVSPLYNNSNNAHKRSEVTAVENPSEQTFKCDKERKNACYGCRDYYNHQEGDYYKEKSVSGDKNLDGYEDSRPRLTGHTEGTLLTAPPEHPEWGSLETIEEVDEESYNWVFSSMETYLSKETEISYKGTCTAAGAMDQSARVQSSPPTGSQPAPAGILQPLNSNRLSSHKGNMRTSEDGTGMVVDSTNGSGTGVCAAMNMKNSGNSGLIPRAGSFSHGRADSLRKIASGSAKLQSFAGNDDGGRRADTPRQGMWCEHCNTRLTELKRHALKLHLYLQKNGKDPGLLSKLEDKLQISENSKKSLENDRCDVCDTHLSQLKQEAISMVQSIKRPSPSDMTQRGVTPPSQSSTHKMTPRTTPHYSSAHHRKVRQGLYPAGPHLVPSSQPPLAAQAQAYLEQNVIAWIGPQKYEQMITSGPGQGSPRYLAGEMTAVRPGYLQPFSPSVGLAQQPYPLSPTSSTSSHTASAAASFFARAAQKLNISSRKKKKHQAPEPQLPQFPTNFTEIIRFSPPPAPPCLMRTVGRMQTPGSGKVKVMLRICPMDGNQGSFLSLDGRKKQVTVYDPTCSSHMSSHRRAGFSAPKMFAFDAIFSQDESMTEVCASSLTEIVQAVVNGADGCLFCYGHARLGKTYTMIGIDDSPQNLGVIPCAIAWLFRLINERKDKTGARFSVRVSAVEVTGKQEKLKDLLADVASGQEAGSSTAPGVYLKEDPVIGSQLENYCELRAPTADRAAYYLDAAVAARTIPEVEEDARNSHLLFTLHVYQYRVEKPSKGSQGVAGGRSRLHLIDLGSCSKSKDGNALSLSALGNVILALLNGQRHIPHRDSKLTQLIRDSLGNLSCRTCMIAHVSPATQAYNETLQVIQLAARIHRMRRRKSKFSSTSSEESSCDESGRLRRPLRHGLRMGTLREGHIYTNALKQSDPEFTDSSEQSCDTVIYVGQNGQPLSDRELTDNEGPPLAIPVIPKTSKLPRSSGGRSSGSNKSSGDDSDNKLTTSRDVSLLSKSGAKLDKPSGLSQPVVVQLPRKITLKSKPPIYNKAKKGEVKGEEQWVDGPTATIKPEEKWVDGPSTDKSCEQWVDGPAYTQKPPSNTEQWIDGPIAMNSSPSHKPLQQTSSLSENRLSKPVKVPASEQWVDGPQEFLTASKNTTEDKDRSQELWSNVQNRAAPDRVTTHMELIQPCHKPMMESSPQVKPKLNKTPLKAPLPAHVLEEFNKPSEASAQNTSLTDSNPSLAAQAPDSRPVSMHSTDTTGTDGASHSCPNHHLQPPKVKEFVHDWVVKHSIDTVKSGGSTEDVKSCSNKMEMFGTPRHELRGPTGSPHHVPMSVTDKVYSKKHHLLNGHNNGSHSAPCSPKLLRTSKLGSALPPPTNPSERTAMWVNSISKVPVPKSKLPLNESSEICTDSVKGDQMSAPECDQNQAELTSVTSAEILDTSAEVTDELDTTIEDIPAMPPLPSAWLMGEEKLKNNDSSSVVSDKERTCNVDKNPVCQSKTLVSSTEQSVDTDTSQCSYTNRESIYELQMDEELEKNDNDDMCRLTFTSDDDFMSTLSHDGRDDNGNVNKLGELSLSPVTPDAQRDILDIVQECYEKTQQSVHHKQQQSVCDKQQQSACDEQQQSACDVQQESISDKHEHSACVETNNNNNDTPPTVMSDECLSPPSSDDSDKSPGNRLCRPMCLRRPDGASNPDLTMECSMFDLEKCESSELKVTEVIEKDSIPESDSLITRTILGQSPEEESQKTVSSPTRRALPVAKSPNKPPVPVRTSSIAKPSVLPKPVFRSKSADSKPPPSPCKLPLKSGDSGSTAIKSLKASKNIKDQNIKEKGKDKTSSKDRSKEKESKKNKDKNIQRSHSSPPASAPCSRAGSVKSSGSIKLSSSSKTKSSLTVDTKSSSPSSSKEKSSLKDIKTSKEKSSSKDTKTSKEKPSSKDTKTSKEKSSSKDVKMVKDKSSKDSKSPKSSRISFLSSKKDKDSSKLPVSKASNSRVSQLLGNKVHAVDSDSGNDSGIASEKKKLLSPYSKVTKPRTNSHSASSGHGSDNSSVISGRFRSKSADKQRGGTSSGYESMIRDSEATGSSTHDSASESSSSGKVRGTKFLKKRSSSSRRSRSAPPRTSESPCSSRHQSPGSTPSKTCSTSPKAWVDTRNLQNMIDEPFEITVYDVDDVERMQRRRKEEAELRALTRRRERIQELLTLQDTLKADLTEAKSRLMVDQNTWSFDLYVAEQMDRDDPNYLEALEKETKILTKRVGACKSRIMMVTCFDASF